MTQLGTQGRGGSNLAASVAHAVTAVGDAVTDGRGGGMPTSGLRASRVLQQRLLDTVGARFAVSRTDRLIGMAHGERRDCGVCMVGGVSTKFDWWFPHIGLAVDLAMPVGGDVEVNGKRAWAETVGILYYPPFTPDLGEAYWTHLEALVAQRRGA